MKHLLTIIAITTILASCQREPSQVIEYQPPVINPPTVPVTGGLVGTVFADDQSAVADAIVTSHGQQTTTDVNGRFSMENFTLYKDGSYVTVDLPGYHQASRKFYAVEGEINVVGIEMIKENYDESFDSNLGKRIASENIEIQIPGGNFIVNQDEVYNGEVKADLFAITVESANSSFKMPGDLTGLNEDLEIQAISNYGIFKLELTSQSGEQLELPLEETSNFEYKVTELELYETPDVLKLWHFDQANGTWIEKGESIFSNGSYFGEIDEAGFWMLGESYDYADIKGSLVDENNFFPNTRIDVQNLDLGYLSSIHTTKSGIYSTRVPQDIDIDLSIYHECNVGRQIKELGVITTDLNIDPILIEMAMDNIEIQGRITDCNGVSSNQPYLKVNFGADQFMYRVDEFGYFDVSFSNCSDEEVSLVAINDVTSEVSESLVLPINNVIEFGNIETCHEVAAGYDIEYNNMDWSANLDSTVIHEWTTSRVNAVEDKLIFSVKMIDEFTGELYLSGAFVFIEGETQADFQLNFKTQGFSIFGVCGVEAIDHDGIISYRFVGASTDIAQQDSVIFPGGIDEVNFNLVYYD